MYANDTGNGLLQVARNLQHRAGKAKHTMHTQHAKPQTSGKQKDTVVFRNLLSGLCTPETATALSIAPVHVDTCCFKMVKTHTQRSAAQTRISPWHSVYAFSMYGIPCMSKLLLLRPPHWPLGCGPTPACHATPAPLKPGTTSQPYTRQHQIRPKWVL